MFAIALVPIVLGVVVGRGGFLGVRGRLTRAGGAGVRTEASLRSEEAFQLANRVAGIPTLAGGAAAIIAGAAGLAMPTTAGLVAAAIVGLVALVAMVFAGARMGTRAALTVPAPARVPAGCSGCACGSGGCGVLQKSSDAS
ncbi:SdpI family protein [Amycolatopsis benzoatilytica]|uniref:SdpI family protein n=1 Tax=Amycolatopsis benzoatilytica TaxID=346045 RepID=UPI0003769786|nr:SdpI family protein [Amycolatopsis benzoatilytica]